MSTCNRKGCKHKARFVMKVSVPAQGWPIDLHQPLQALIGIKLCKDCFDKVNVQELLFPDNGESSIGEMLESLSHGNCPPDFARAWISKVSLDSKEWREFEETGKAGGELQ